MQIEFFSSKGGSVRMIASEIGISKSKVHRIIKCLKTERSNIERVTQ